MQPPAAWELEDGCTCTVRGGPPRRRHVTDIQMTMAGPAPVPEHLAVGTAIVNAAQTLRQVRAIFQPLELRLCAGVIVAAIGRAVRLGHRQIKHHVRVTVGLSRRHIEFGDVPAPKLLGSDGQQPGLGPDRLALRFAQGQHAHIACQIIDRRHQDAPHGFWPVSSPFSEAFYFLTSMVVWARQTGRLAGVGSVEPAHTRGTHRRRNNNVHRFLTDTLNKPPPKPAAATQISICSFISLKPHCFSWRCGPMAPLCRPKLLISIYAALSQTQIDKPKLAFDHTKRMLSLARTPALSFSAL